MDLVQLVQESTQLLPLFATTAWAIWHHRNKSRLQETSVPLERIASFAKEYLLSFKTLNSPPPTVKRQIVQRWFPPDRDSVKVNFDGPWFPESDEAGTGVVIRNSDGAVMAAMAEKIAKPPSAEVLESLAARHAVVFTLEVGFHRVCLEGDAVSVIKALQNSGMGLPLGGHILKDILSLAKSF
nr:uncharacterized protein LOC112010605 [Quercus suber]